MPASDLPVKTHHHAASGEADLAEEAVDFSGVPGNYFDLHAGIPPIAVFNAIFPFLVNFFHRSNFFDFYSPIDVHESKLISGANTKMVLDFSRKLCRVVVPDSVCFSKLRFCGHGTSIT